MSEREIAERIWQAHRDRKAFESLLPASGAADLRTAYRIQDHYVERLLQESAGPPCGYKIGLTTSRMQKMCGIGEPIAGRILRSRVHGSGCRLSAASFVRLGIESELCVMLAKDLPGRDGGHSLEEIESALEGVCAAFELVDDRNADYSALDAFSLVADNSWSAGVVLSQPGLPSDLASLTGTLRINGKVVDSGSSAEALEHPLAVVNWLSAHLHRRGESLRAGDLIMTGSIVPTRFAQPGEVFEFELQQLSPVRVVVE